MTVDADRVGDFSWYMHETWMVLVQVVICKVEFYQPSYWLYSVSNLLVFQQLVILYLGEILVGVVSEIV